MYKTISWIILRKSYADLASYSYERNNLTHKLIATYMHVDII